MFLRRGEKFQDVHVVVADACKLDPLLVESRLGRLQLNELSFAVRAPVRRTVKQQNSPFRSLQRFERLRLAELVGQGKVRAPSGRRRGRRSPNSLMEAT